MHLAIQERLPLSMIRGLTNALLVQQQLILETIMERHIKVMA